MIRYSICSWLSFAIIIGSRIDIAAKTTNLQINESPNNVFDRSSLSPWVSEWVNGAHVIQIEHIFHTWPCATNPFYSFASHLHCNGPLSFSLPVSATVRNANLFADHRQSLCPFRCFFVPSNDRQRHCVAFKSHSVFVNRMQFDWTKHDCVRQLDVTFVVKHDVMSCHSKLTSLTMGECVCMSGSVFVCCDPRFSFHARSQTPAHARTRTSLRAIEKMKCRRRAEQKMIEKKTRNRSLSASAVNACHTHTHTHQHMCTAAIRIGGDWNNCSRSRQSPQQTPAAALFCV